MNRSGIRKSILSFLLAIALSILFVDEINHIVLKYRYGISFHKIVSPSLSAFAHKTVRVRVAVLPARPAQTQGVVYHIPGLGSDESGILAAAALFDKFNRHAIVPFTHVYINPEAHDRYHAFVDSPNNGPWLSALMHDVIPTIERDYHLAVSPKRRFLTGHSSGGWAAMWIYLNNLDSFAGVWASAPDPLDFRSFFGVNLVPGSLDNFYYDHAGTLRPADRKNTISLKESVLEDDEEDSGEFRSYEWMWSLPDAQHSPRRMFDRASGVLDQDTLKQWHRYDMTGFVRRRCGALRKQIQDRIHLVYGGRDTYFLDQPTQLFCDELKSCGIRATCEAVPKRQHEDLYFASTRFPRGLMLSMLSEMEQTARGIPTPSVTSSTSPSPLATP